MDGSCLGHGVPLRAVACDSNDALIADALCLTRVIWKTRRLTEEPRGSTCVRVVHVSPPSPLKIGAPCFSGYQSLRLCEWAHAGVYRTVTPGTLQIGFLGFVYQDSSLTLS